MLHWDVALMWVLILLWFQWIVNFHFHFVVTFLVRLQFQWGNFVVRLHFSLAISYFLFVATFFFYWDIFLALNSLFFATFPFWCEFFILLRLAPFFGVVMRHRKISTEVTNVSAVLRNWYLKVLWFYLKFKKNIIILSKVLWFYLKFKKNIILSILVNKLKQTVYFKQEKFIEKTVS